MLLEDNKVITIILIGILLLFLVSKFGVFCYGPDGEFHALGGFFFYDLAKWWFENPTFSLNNAMDFIVDYQEHYKFFGGISYYPPLQSLIIAFIAFFTGKNLMAVYLATALETIGIIFFSLKIYEILYGKNQKMMYLLVFLLAVHPVIFLLGASSSVDPGLTLFSVMMIYFFIQFLKKDEKKYLYLTFIVFGLGILLKRPMLVMIPVIILSIFLERKFYLFKKNLKPLFLSIIIALLIILPYLALEMWYLDLGISKMDERTILASINTDYNIIIKYASLSLFTFFGNYLLIIFFVGKLWYMRKKRVLGEFTILLLIISIFIFYNYIIHVQERYLLPAIPFIIILSVNGIQNLLKSYPKSLIVSTLVTIILITTPLISFNYNTTIIKETTSTDYEQTAFYISENSLEPTSAISPYSRYLALAFNLIDEKNVYVVHTPHESKTKSIKELKTMLDTKEGCISRPSKPEWEKFEMCHPPIGWAVVQEEWDGIYVPYKLKDVLEERDDFCLVNTIEGNIPNRRVFIYRRCYN